MGDKDNKHHKLILPSIMMRGKIKGKIKQEKVSEVGTYKCVNAIVAEII